MPLFHFLVTTQTHHPTPRGKRRVAQRDGQPNMAAVPLEEAVEKMRSVPLDSDRILTARDMGISFGDD